MGCPPYSVCSRRARRLPRLPWWKPPPQRGAGSSTRASCRSWSYAPKTRRPSWTQAGTPPPVCSDIVLDALPSEIDNVKLAALLAPVTHLSLSGDRVGPQAWRPGPTDRPVPN